jgi:hypothetical protein
MPAVVYLIQGGIEDLGRRKHLFNFGVHSPMDDVGHKRYPGYTRITMTNYR